MTDNGNAGAPWYAEGAEGPPLAALFDFDMTVADTGDSILVSMNLFAEEMGLREVTREDLMKAIGLTLEETWVSYWGRCEPWWPDYDRDRYKEREISGFKPFPGAVDTINRCRDKGIGTAIVTNRWMAALAVKAAGLEGLFDVIVGAEEAEKPKPDPAPVELALKLLGVSARRAVLAGDSDLDIMAASAAGVRGVGVATGGTSAERLRDAGAWKVVGALTEMLPLLGL
jgi:HAD superfamily hydrolase (TIGR01509 family)